MVALLWSEGLCSRSVVALLCSEGLCSRCVVALLWSEGLCSRCVVALLWSEGLCSRCVVALLWSEGLCSRFMVALLAIVLLFKDSIMKNDIFLCRSSFLSHQKANRTFLAGEVGWCVLKTCIYAACCQVLRLSPALLDRNQLPKR